MCFFISDNYIKLRFSSDIREIRDCRVRIGRDLTDVLFYG